MKFRSSVISFLILISISVFTPFVEKSLALPSGVSCTSGDAVDSGSGNIHIVTFSASSNVSDGSCTFTVPQSVYAIDYLVVAGGGGGNSGGGGAGGLVTSWEVKSQDGNTTLAARGTPLTVFPGNRIPVRVGVGGTAGSGGNYGGYGISQSSMPLGSSGHDSQFGSVTAAGGGRGGYGFGCSGTDSSCDQSGASGGSGGGGAYDFNRTNSSASSQSSVIGASTFGHGGGAATGSGGYRAGSGGGGAGGVGLNATQLHIGGSGGSGVRVNIDGSSQIFACGGGGGINENVGVPRPRYGPFSNGTYTVNDVWSYFGIYEIYAVEHAYSDDNGAWTYNSSTNSFTDGLGQEWLYNPTNDSYEHSTFPTPRDISLDLNPEEEWILIEPYVFTVHDLVTDSDWTWNRWDDFFIDPQGHRWDWDWSDEAYHSNQASVVDSVSAENTQYSVPTGTYQSPNGDHWTPDDQNSAWSNTTSGEYWQRTSLGGGLGGCADAGSGSNIRVNLTGGASSASDATSGLNGFGHGGGGTDPESTVAGRGGNGVVIIRYVTEDLNCPNDGSNAPNFLPTACIARLKITAGDTSNSTRNLRSVDALNSPISFSSPGDTISLITAVAGLDVTIWNNRILATVTSSTSPLIGGTYPIMYQITSGSDISQSFVLITVRDPSQHTQTRVPVDPRDATVVLPKIIIGRVDAVQVCVTPRTTSGYPVLPKVELARNPGGATVDSPNGKNLRMQGNSESITANIKYIELTSAQSRLIQQGKSIVLDINISNTAVGGNGSCEFGTDSTMTLFPLKLTQIRSFTAVPKNGRQNN